MLSYYAYVGGNPLTGADPLGLFGPPQHIYITYVAMRAEGYGIWQSLDAGFGAAAWDFLPRFHESQLPENANAHGMAVLGQTRGEAIAGWNKYIDDNLATCTEIGLEAGLHAGEDASAGGHGFTPDGPHAIGIHHAYMDWWPEKRNVAEAIETAQGGIKQFKRQCGCGK
jgi:hypothetical protein